MNNNQKAFIVIALMAALSIAAIATVVNTAAALPSGPPANRGTETARCASAQQGPSANGILSFD
jgi:hypothetical protein